MGFFDGIKSSVGSVIRDRNGMIDGPNKKEGGHDHTHNTGKDRTPAQKKADAEKKK